ncbi:carbohydrate ABC transporter permease [Bacillus sp. SD088]|uniref:carbohydrate ABC transporter permease n=1 Tax=Bacillus sp. SD088 TaxID=2782012 RepID=UPI001A965173|nr:carbohydrate ABC transporter permease [Bacillus sp. SD088]MBO0995730.1 carbohydrate ABC transporter permease [Bacillus sp. SD088]
MAAVSTKKTKTLKGIFFYIGILLILVISLFPFFIMLMTALKSSQEAISRNPTFFPKEWTIQHFVDIFNPSIFPYLTYLENSFVVALTASIISVVIAIFGAYALSRLDFKGRLQINASFYTVYMFSGILLVVPLFKIISGLGLYDTKTSLIIVMIVQTLPTAILMLISFFETIPKDLEEAAKIDGLNRIKIIFYIIIPLSLSGIISVFVYCFMVAWNDFLFASIFFSSDENFTLPVGLNSLFSTPDYIWGRMMAASIVTALPVVIMYAISESLIKGNVTSGGVKE